VWNVLAAGPEITSINVTSITQTSARILWSKGRTRVVSSIVVYYRATTTTTWTMINRASHSTAYTVSTLQPGTQYQFYVKVVSYGKYSTSNVTTITTGRWQLLFVCSILWMMDNVWMIFNRTIVNLLLTLQLNHDMSQKATYSTGSIVQGTACILLSRNRRGLCIASNSHICWHLSISLIFSQCEILVKVWNDNFSYVYILQNAFVCMYYTAPRITGECTFVSSTSRSLTFRWTAAKSATSYQLVGHSKSASVGTSRITVSSLTPGSRYTFTVWAVGWKGLRSNNIICTDSTGLSEIALIFFFLHQHYFVW